MKIEIAKNAEGKVTHVIVNDGSKYLPDEDGKSDFVRYFGSSKSNWALFFTGKKIYFLQVVESAKEDGTMDDMYITWEGVTEWTDNREIPKIENYLKESRQYQIADLQESKKNAAAKEASEAAARKAKYSIEGKNVASVKIINFKQPSHFGNYEGSITFDIEATLKDGTKISTEKSDAGFKSDYVIEYQNMPGKMSSHYSANLYNNTYNTGFIKNDKVVVSVKSKYNPSLKDSKEVVPTYDYAKGTVYFQWIGQSGGDNGHNLKLEIKSVKHAVTGEELYQYRLTTLTFNKVICEGKIKPDQIMKINANGRGGFNANNSGERAGDAGNGGTVTIYKDPNISSLTGFLDVTVEGGGAGKGANSILYDGRSGRDGKVNIVTKSVSF